MRHPPIRRFWALAALLALAWLVGPVGHSGSAASDIDADGGWERVEQRLVEGDASGARAFAAGTAGPDVAALRRYAADRVVDEPARTRYQSLVEARSRRSADERASAHALASAAVGRVSTVTEVLALEVLAVTGPVAESMKSLSDAARLAEELGWRTRSAELYNRATLAAEANHDWRSAAEWADRTRVMWSSLGRHVEAAKALVNVGSAAKSAHDWHRALWAFRNGVQQLRALDAWEAAATGEMNLGILLADVGLYAQSMSAFERATEAAGHVDADESDVRFEVMGTQASVYQDIGDMAAALRLHQQTIDGYRALIDAPGASDEPSRLREARIRAARSLGDRGKCRMEIGDREAGIGDLEASLKEMSALEDDDGVATAMCALGLAVGKGGDAGRGIALTRGAAEKFRANSDDLKTVSAEGCVGDIHAAVGRWDEALAAWSRASEVADRIEAVDLVVEYAASSARALVAKKEYVAAIAAARRARLRLADVVAGLGDIEAGTARESRSALYDAGVRAGLALSDPAVVAEFVEGGRAVSLLEAIGSQKALEFAVLPRDLADAGTAVRDKVAGLRSQVASLLATGERTKELQRLSSELRAAEDDLSRLGERIRREAKTASHVVYPEPASVPEIQAVLRPEEALIEYAEAGGTLAALVILPKAVRVVDLGSSSAVDTLCGRLRPSDAGLDPGNTAVKELAKLIWSKLDLPETVRRVLVSPDGALGFAPLALLDDAREFVMIPSGTVLRFLRTATPPAAVDPKTGPILALGGVDYRVPRPPASAVYLRGRGLKDLPGTRGEAIAIGTRQLLGADATEARLRTELLRSPAPAPAPGPRPDPGTPRPDVTPRWFAVHIASHGLLDRDRPLLTCLALTPSGDDDGFLTVGEVLGLRVPADLVVLSACDTAGGTHFRADGILGLNYAFMVAGAPRIVSSLWDVDDDATGALMKAFYAARRGGETTAAALRKAQRFVAVQPLWSHPKYWAAWTLWGLPD